MQREPSQPGHSFLRPFWLEGSQASQGRATPHPADLTERQTLKQQSFSGPAARFPGPGALPRTPEISVQGQYGHPRAPGVGGQGQALAGGFPNGPLRTPQGPAGQQLFASGPGGSFPPGFNAFNGVHPGAAFSPSGSGMVAAPRAPTPFRPDGFPAIPGSFGTDPWGPGGGGGRGDGRRKKQRRVPIWARVVIAVLLFFLVLGGAGFAYYQVNFAGAVNHIVGQQVQRAPGEENPNANLSNGILSGPRINILLLGSDTDQKFQGQYIAQTDIVVTIDPGTRTVGMLSIPRDFYIPVPGYGLHKLDEAYGLGGVGLSRRTIEQD
ncbi:MAG TPA: LCP family protein, partial [Ktedonobacteraceae bacterium]